MFPNAELTFQTVKLYNLAVTTQAFLLRGSPLQDFWPALDFSAANAERPLGLMATQTGV